MPPVLHFAIEAVALIVTLLAVIAIVALAIEFERVTRPTDVEAGEKR